MFFLVPVPEAAMSAMDVAVKWREALGATTERSRECMCVCSLDAAFLNMATQQVMQSMRALQARVWIESCTAFLVFCKSCHAASRKRRLPISGAAQCLHERMRGLASFF